jgi:thiamine biosynthesis lipoprotein ApbE
VAADLVSARQTRRDQHVKYAEDNGLGSTSWTALGTVAHVLTTDPDVLPIARRAVELVLADIDLAASRFRDDSELVAVNTAGGRWMAISPLLCQAVRVALDAADWTDGLVDPTVGATLVDLGYDRTFLAIEPSPSTLPLQIRQAHGWQHVELDESRGRIRIPAGAVLDLGATAKGLAADLAADAAADAAGCGVLVNLGGDLSVSGEPPEAGWAVNVGDTSSLDVMVGAESEQTVVVRAGGLATSSIRARRWQRGGSEIHHLIDPRIASPSSGRFRTATVAAVTATLANAASTAAVILGAQAPSWLRDREFAARLVDRDGTVVRVGGWPAPDEPAAQ